MLPLLFAVPAGGNQRSVLRELPGIEAEMVPALRTPQNQELGAVFGTHQPPASPSRELQS